MSGCTKTVSNSVRMMAPVGQASRHPARTQCLQTSDENNHENWSFTRPSPFSCPRPCPFPSASFSTNATCRHVVAPSCNVLSNELPLNANPSAGSWFHCLHATSQALQPMQTVVSVKNPLLMQSSLVLQRRFHHLRFGRALAHL